jgi:hypothetical protein
LYTSPQSLIPSPRPKTLATQTNKPQQPGMIVSMQLVYLGKEEKLIKGVY